MDIIAQFITRYRREYDFYEQACRMSAQVLDSNLQSAGIRAIVTSRAKNPSRLEAKVRQRAQSRVYSSVDEIYDDIVDLAGVRVALYFPGEREEVGRIIRRLFTLSVEPKKFPGEPRPSYKKRFSGYWATHYRIRLPDDLLNEAQKRYADASVEIQVASVLMHAWSEVEHDLVYKPLQGALSEDEYAILDELNGLVLAGEIALERLQRAGELRVQHDREYGTHYELASSLLDMSRKKLVGLNIHDSAIGRVDLLFQLLRDLELNKPEELARYVDALHADFEKRPLAEQIIDRILSEDPTRYAAYEKIHSLDLPMATASPKNVPQNPKSEEVGRFIGLWVEYERIRRAIADIKGYQSIGRALDQYFSSASDNSREMTDLQERARNFRNQLVHGLQTPSADDLRAEVAGLNRLISLTKSEFGLSRNPENYESTELSGAISFDYSNNDGRFLLGSGDMAFETAWSSADSSSVHAYSDPYNISKVALAIGASTFEEILDARIYDASSRVRLARVGDILVWLNTSGYYLATKVVHVSARTHGGDRDELIFSYKIASDKRDSFS